MSRYLFIQLLCILIFLFRTDFIRAQRNPFTELMKVANMPRSGDSLVKQQVDYIDPGMAGTNIIWDFRKVNPVNDYYIVSYRTATTDSCIIGGLEHGTNYSYLLNGDMLLHTGYENSTTIMKYSAAELKMRYPFRYGDLLNSEFSGHGEYCHSFPIHVSGKTIIEADATGTLRAPLGLTFKNVLRVKSLREYYQTALDSVRMILESYSWYAPGKRYPVFETVKTITQKSGKRETEHKLASFFYSPPELASQLSDTSCWKQSDSMYDINGPDGILNNIRIIPNPVLSNLTCEYDLTSDAIITIKLFDNNGITRFSSDRIQKGTGHHAELIEMEHLAPGIYIINMIVNDMAKFMKVIKN